MILATGSIFFILCQIWLCTYVSASLQLTIEKILAGLRIRTIWRSDELLKAEEGLVSEPYIGMDQSWLGTTLLTSKMKSECVAACLVQHGCKDITNNLDMGRCDQHVFTRGGFGAIYRGFLHDGRPVAIKCIEPFNDREDPEQGKNLKRAAREIYIWSHCSHRGVLPVLGFARFRGKISLLTPWRDAGSLKRHVSCGSLPTPLQTCMQLAVAVEHLHANGIVHGDIKPDNVLMTDQGEAQLADFGSAALTYTNTLNFTHTASFNFSIRFAAPEVLNEESHAFTKESDIYALGMTMFNIMSGQLPFADKSAPSFINAVINMKIQPSRPDFDITLGGNAAKDGMWNLLKRCLDHTPSNRPTASEVREALIKIGDLNDIDIDQPNGRVGGNN